MSMQPVKSASALDMCNSILGYNGEDFLYKGTGGYVVKPDQRLNAPTSPQKDEFVSSSSVSNNLAFAGGVTLLAAGILFRKNIAGLFKNGFFKNFKMPEFNMPEFMQLQKLKEKASAAKTTIKGWFEKIKSFFSANNNSAARQQAENAATDTNDLRPAVSKTRYATADTYKGEIINTDDFRTL